MVPDLRQLAATQLVHVLTAKCCIYISYYVTVLVYTNKSLGCTVVCCYLLLCLPAAANLYIVGIPGCIAVVLLVLVETSKNYIMLLKLAMRHQHF